MGVCAPLPTTGARIRHCSRAQNKLDGKGRKMPRWQRHEENYSFVQSTSRNHRGDDSSSLRHQGSWASHAVREANADSPKRKRSGGTPYQGHYSDGDAGGSFALHTQRYCTERILR
jgi:hypothetical protein